MTLGAYLQGRPEPGPHDAGSSLLTPEAFLAGMGPRGTLDAAFSLERARLEPALRQAHLEARARGDAEGREALFALAEDGDLERYARWARRYVPDAFSLLAPPRACAARPVEALDRLPARVYHGTPAAVAVVRVGFALQPAAALRSREPGLWAWMVSEEQAPAWLSGDTIEWGRHTWAWFQGLSGPGRASLRAQTGNPLRTIKDLGDALSLLWVSYRPEQAAAFSEGLPVLALDPRALPLYGAFEDTEMVTPALVLVLPRGGCPGDPRAILGLLEVPGRTTTWRSPDVPVP